MSEVEHLFIFLLAFVFKPMFLTDYTVSSRAGTSSHASSKSLLKQRIQRELILFLPEPASLLVLSQWIPLFLPLSICPLVTKSCYLCLLLDLLLLTPIIFIATALIQVSPPLPWKNKTISQVSWSPPSSSLVIHPPLNHHWAPLFKSCSRFSFCL